MTIGISLGLNVVALTLAAGGPRSAEETLKSFQLPDGLSIEVVAAEPLVMDPVAITFDADGRMYAVEYADYPTGPGEGKAPLSRIRVFEDTDGDGRFDASKVFADRLDFAQGLLAYKDGLLVTNAPNILYLRDTNGDGVADVREVLFKGFKPGNPQLRTAHPRWGMDNWIYLTNGLSGGEVTVAKGGGAKVGINRLDFRFHPITMEYEPATGLGQFGNTFDDWGHRFYCSNRNPIMFTVLPYRALIRNPYALITKGYEDVAPSGGDAKVYPLVETRTTAFSHTGTHTAACGVTAYRGELLGPEYVNNVFVCEPTGHLITQSRLSPNGASLTATRARPKVEFLASTDKWFRPVSLANGPDGALYVVDMYRAVIEHPQYMTNYFPKEYIENLDFRAGSDRGRIYRIKLTGAKTRSYVPPQTTADLVALLSDKNGWRRQLGQRLLVERQVKDAAPDLKQLVASGNHPLARLHALWTLEGIGMLDAKTVRLALGDRDPRVQEHAIALTPRFHEIEPALLRRIESDIVQRQDTSVRTNFMVALALGEIDDPMAGKLLAQLARRHFADAWMPEAILSAVKDRAGNLISSLVQEGGFLESAETGRGVMLTRLAEVVGSRGDETELAQLFHSISGTQESGSWWQTALLTGLARGLPRHRGALGRTSLARLLSQPPASLRDAIADVGRLLDKTTQIAADDKRAVPDRIAAIRLLGYQGFTEVKDVLPDLLRTDQPVGVQLACIDAMRELNNDAVTPMVFDAWPRMGPQTRTAALDLLFRRTSTMIASLEAMNSGKIQPSVVSLDQRTRLLRSGNARIKELASKLFGGEVSANRQQVIDQYKSALSMTGDATKGRAAFKKVCATCHKIDGDGHEVGPDISDVRNKTRETLMLDVLDPNRAVEPRWTDYIVTTSDGRLLTGLLASETADAVVLLRAEEKQDVVPRTEIELIQASGKSLMPEGVEKDLTVREFADLLAFLKQRQ